LKGFMKVLAHGGRQFLRGYDWDDGLPGSRSRSLTRCQTAGQRSRNRMRWRCGGCTSCCSRRHRARRTDAPPARRSPASSCATWPSRRPTTRSSQSWPGSRSVVRWRLVGVIARRHATRREHRRSTALAFAQEHAPRSSGAAASYATGRACMFATRSRTADERYERERPTKSRVGDPHPQAAGDGQVRASLRLRDSAAARTHDRRRRCADVVPRRRIVVRCRPIPGPGRLRDSSSTRGRFAIPAVATPRRPDAKALAEDADDEREKRDLDHFMREHDPLDAAQLFRLRIGAEQYRAFISHQFETRPSDAAMLTPSHHALTRLPVRELFTTNYDSLIELAFQEFGPPLAVSVSSREDVSPNPARVGPVLAWTGGAEGESLAMALSKLGLRVRAFDGDEEPMCERELKDVLNTFDALVDAPSCLLRLPLPRRTGAR
jgi:hypothetical protein